MSDIQRSISRLLHFARQKGLIAPDDEVYAANRLIDVLGVEEYVPHAVDETLETATPVLEEMLDDAAARGLIENTVNERDLFDTHHGLCDAASLGGRAGVPRALCGIAAGGNGLVLPSEHCIELHPQDAH